MISCQTVVSSVSTGETTTRSIIEDTTTYEDTTSLESDIESFRHIRHYHEILSMETKQGEPLQEYIVYFYSHGCAACVQFKQEVVVLLRNLQALGVVVFVVDVWELSEQDSGDMNQFLLEIQQTFIAVPCLVTVLDGSFENYRLGTAAVREELTRWIADRSS